MTTATQQSDDPFTWFSDKARKAMGRARREAERLQHDFIGTEHLLLGLLGDDEGIVQSLFTQFKINREDLRTSFAQQLTPGSSTCTQFPFTPRAKRVLEAAIDVERELKTGQVGTGHLLAGILSDPETPAGRVLGQYIRTVDELQSALRACYEEEHAAALESKSEGPVDLQGSLNVLPEGVRRLSPAQSHAYTRLLDALPNGNIFLLWGDSLGITTVLRALHKHTGGAFLSMPHFLEKLSRNHPLALEESLETLLIENLAVHTHVYMDEMDLIANVVSGGCNSYPRSNLIGTVMTRVANFAVERGVKLIFGNTANYSNAVHLRCFSVKIAKFTPDDYAFLYGVFLKPELAAALDYKKIHRFAPNLNAYQIQHACQWRQCWDSQDTDGLIEYLRSQEMASNVDLAEVRPVELHQLKGVEDVIRALETNIILPLENDKLADELGLKPKRGVLLAGPPGTGKTTVGRALAHRLKSKFFLVDGTFIAGTSDFYNAIRRVFTKAEQNAPSIIFIDDSDVIFENSEDTGLYRYLLTMLDGLESESAGRVCVMLTAMNIGSLPPALIRSGRIELWLEMRLPDAAARASILTELAQKLTAQIGVLEIDRVAQATDGFTGADLTRLIEDTKALYFYDKVKALPIKVLTEYALTATEGVRANKKLYAEAEQRAHKERAN